MPWVPLFSMATGGSGSLISDFLPTQELKAIVVFWPATIVRERELRGLGAGFCPVACGTLQFLKIAVPNSGSVSFRYPFKYQPKGRGAPWPILSSTHIP